MRNSPFFYPIVSRVAGVVLLLAGGLKTQELIGGLVESWAVILATAFELMFGLWLLMGFYPRWTRILALAFFTVLLNVALIRALEGRESCGCFGKAPVQPWYAVTLDALLLGGLLLAPSAVAGTGTIFRAMRIRWLTFAALALPMLFALGWPVAAKLEGEAKPIPTESLADTPAGIDEAALKRVIEGVERNHKALHTLVCTHERLSIQHPVKWTGTRDWQEGKKVVKKTGTWIEPKEEKRKRSAAKTWIRGEEVRRDGLPNPDGGKGGSILLYSKGKRIQYDPEFQFASIIKANFADEGLGESIDLRCAGFHPPLRSIAELLQRSRVLNAGLVKIQGGREVIRVRARMKTAREEFDVTSDFEPSMNYLPSRVVYQYLPHGGIRCVTDISYQQVGSDGAWFPRTISDRCFIHNTTTNPDAQTGQNLSCQLTVKVQAVGRGVQDEDFDPILPPRTRLLGDLVEYKRRTPNKPIRASTVTLPKPKVPRPEAAQDPQKKTSGAPPWSFAAGMNCLLLGSCWALRKRLAF